MFRHLNILLSSLFLAAPLALLAPSVASAQSTAAKILEKSRAEAREIEELRKILNGPDQNMRLATFDAMVKSGNEAMRQVAYEAALASADSALRAMAFKALVMSLGSMHLTLAIDPSTSKQMQSNSAERFSRMGNGFILKLGKKDLDAGTFDNGLQKGQVSGLELTFGGGQESGTLTLRDDNTLAGVVRLEHGREHFLATARLR